MEVNIFSLLRVVFVLISYISVHYFDVLKMDASEKLHARHLESRG